MNILYIYADSKTEWNCSEWRCAIPGRAIEIYTEHKAKMMSINDFIMGEARRFLGWVNIIVLQRLAVGNTVHEMIFWKAMGIPIVVDLDDAYHLMTDDNSAYHYWIMGELKNKKEDSKEETIIHLKESPYKNLEWAIKLIDGVTSPSQIILDHWKNITRTYLVPNYIELKSYITKPQDETDGAINIGWLGGTTHWPSFKNSGVLYALKRVVEENSHINIIIGGGDYRVFNHIMAGDNRKSLAKWVEFKEYPNLLSQVDIGIAPLSGMYDDCRSWIKVLEFIAIGKPWVASDRPPYREFAPYGKLVKNVAVDWYKALSYTVKNYAELSGIALSNMKVAQTYDIEANVGKIVDTYQHIIDDVMSGTGL